jgi:hypothetical protein
MRDLTRVRTPVAWPNVIGRCSDPDSPRYAVPGTRYSVFPLEARQEVELARNTISAIGASRTTTPRAQR